MNKTILVTGGAGYIGSHAVLACLEAGYDVVVLDNLCNSSAESLRRVERICGRAPKFIEGDTRNAALLDLLFVRHDIDAVMDFAGLKAVGESVQQPLAYYQNNINGTINLCQAMTRAGVFRLVFSSSASVYGEATEMPLSETHPADNPTNPYGRSKRMIERVLLDLAASDPRWGIAMLRYFNPIGAHESGLIGEDPNGVPNNLVPYISQVAVGKLNHLSIFGGDYPTQDGTGVRDYIHVVDLAEGHLMALNEISKAPGARIWNLGTGQGYTVLEIVQAFERASGRSIPYKIVDRRPGDVAEYWADPSRSAAELGWKATRDLDAMMRDTWRWQSMNPRGYASPLPSEFPVDYASQRLDGDALRAEPSGASVEASPQLAAQRAAADLSKAMSTDTPLVGRISEA